MLSLKKIKERKEGGGREQSIMIFFESYLKFMKSFLYVLIILKNITITHRHTYTQPKSQATREV